MLLFVTIKKQQDDLSNHMMLIQTFLIVFFVKYLLLPFLIYSNLSETIFFLISTRLRLPFIAQEFFVPANLMIVLRILTLMSIMEVNIESHFVKVLRDHPFKTSAFLRGGGVKNLPNLPTDSSKNCRWQGGRAQLSKRYL